MLPCPMHHLLLLHGLRVAGYGLHILRGRPKPAAIGMMRATAGVCLNAQLGHKVPSSPSLKLVAEHPVFIPRCTA